MKIRLGYVANALRLSDCSPSRTTTLKQINKLATDSDRVSCLTTISRHNLENTIRILQANHYDQIFVYRFSSKLIPFCTHPDFSFWDYTHSLQEKLRAIGHFVKTHQMRVSLHPDHFTLSFLFVNCIKNSTKKHLEQE